jgi:hypothetical protein
VITEFVAHAAAARTDMTGLTGYAMLHRETRQGDYGRRQKDQQTNYRVKYTFTHLSGTEVWAVS